jgi:hypothetical protein
MSNIRTSFRWIWLGALIGILGMFLIVSPLMAASGRGGAWKGAGSTSGTSLNQAEIDWLTHMRQEEKLAHDVYQVLFEKWGVSIFSNIANSEQRHTDAIENQIDKYGVSDPVANENTHGNFADPALNTLYEQLITRGLSSLKDAYQVGLDIETLDIKDLKIAIIDTTHSDIDNVYSHLLHGSYSHLNAFQLAVI